MFWWWFLLQSPQSWIFNPLKVQSWIQSWISDNSTAGPFTGRNAHEFTFADIHARSSYKVIYVAERLISCTIALTTTACGRAARLVLAPASGRPLPLFLPDWHFLADGLPALPVRSCFSCSSLLTLAPPPCSSCSSCSSLLLPASPYSSFFLLGFCSSPLLCS